MKSHQAKKRMMQLVIKVQAQRVKNPPVRRYIQCFSVYLEIN